MSRWFAIKAKRVLAAFLRIGWEIKQQKGTYHKILSRPDWEDYMFSFPDGNEVGPPMLARISKRTGLKLEDL